MVKTFITISVALVVYFGIMMIVSFISAHREGVELNEFLYSDPSSISVQTIRLPYFERLSRPATRILMTILYSDRSETRFLIVPRSNIHGFDVFLNGELVFSLGDSEHFGNMWTRSFLVPLNLREGRNELVVRIRALYDLKLKQPFFLVKRVDWFRHGLELIVCEGSSVFASGALLTIGAILIGLFLKMRPWTGPYLTLGMSFVFSAIYMMNLWYIPPMMSARAFLILKRLVYASSYMATGLYSAGVCQLANKKLLIRISLVLGVAFFSAVMLIPNFWVAREFHEITSVVPLILLMIPLIVLLKLKEIELASPAAFIAVVALHHNIVILSGSPLPTILGIGEIYFVFAFSIYLIKEFEDIRERLQRLELESLLDPLTGAYNRRVLRDVTTSGNDALIFFDLDGFKKLNDEMGHDYGDEILKRFVESIKQEIRFSDMVIRYGGDEFVVILRNCSNKEARNIAKRIVNRFKEETNLTASFGVSSLSVGLSKALEFADMKMYQMKSSKKL